MPPRNFLFSVFVIASVIGGSSHAQATSKVPRYGVLIYSDYCLDKETDDAVGGRVMIIRDGDGDRLLFEWSDGPMEGPVKASALTIDDQTSKIVFTVDTGSGDSFDGAGHFVRKDDPAVATYKGTISDSSIALSVDGQSPEKNWLLPRVRDLSAKVKHCR